MKGRVLSFVLLLAAGPCLAAPKRMEPKPAPRVDGAVNLRVDVSAKYLELEGTARFITANASQVDFTTGGDKAYLVKNDQAEGVEFKKTAFLVNLLPVLNPADDKEISVQIQVELSGPSNGIQVGKSHVPDIATWQWKAAFTLPRGRKTVVVEAPARLEITIDRAE